MIDLITQTLYPVTHDLGGFKVHRTLPRRERTTVGPFIFFDQMEPAQLPTGEGIDVRLHLRHVWWNFVSPRPERIVQAREDWQARRFPVVPDYAAERIEIPAVPNTVSYP